MRAIDSKLNSMEKKLLRLKKEIKIHRYSHGRENKIRACGSKTIYNIYVPIF